MIIVKKKNELQALLQKKRITAGGIGFVPTMGALHQGHISLIEISKKENKVTVCSIFVNPAQFNDPRDFEKYPVTLDKDIYQLERSGCDILFLPSREEIYPGKTYAEVHYDLGYLEEILEGKFRPGHFQGVGRVVDILLTLVQPDKLYLGQKDYQQCMVIKRLIELKGISGKIDVRVAPTLRENDGLAMSSRNLRLDAGARKKAPALSKALHHILEHYKATPFDQLKKEATAMLEKVGFRVDYIEIADADTLKPVNNVAGKKKLVALGAAYLGDIRLIDNFVFNDYAS